MATTKSTTKADRGSTYVINVVPKDEDGEAVTPSTMKWSLLSIDGSRVINNRENIPVTSPSTSNDIVLSGDDLGLPEGGDRWRLFVVEYTYTSDLGSGLVGRQSLSFEIDDTDRGDDDV